MSTKNNQSRAPDLDKYIKSSKKHRYVSYYQGAQLYNMGYSLFVRTAKLAGANLPIRKIILSCQSNRTVDLSHAISIIGSVCNIAVLESKL